MKMKTHTLFTVLVSAAIGPACARHATPPTPSVVARETQDQSAEPKRAPISESNDESADAESNATVEAAKSPAAPQPAAASTEATDEPTTMGVSPW